MGTSVKGRTTIRTAAVFFLISAILEIFDYNSATALFGHIHVAAFAVFYHAIFAALYGLSGIGLWTGKIWGYRALMATTVAYTVDKLQLLLFPETLYDYVLQQLTVTRDLIGMVPKEKFLQIIVIFYVAIMLCWLSFAIYIHMRREYFED